MTVLRALCMVGRTCHLCTGMVIGIGSGIGSGAGSGTGAVIGKGRVDSLD